MARLYVDGAGLPIAFRRDTLEDSMNPAPSGTFFEFDEDTNAALVNEIASNLKPFTVITGVLKRNGATVTPAADGDKAAVRKAAANAISTNDTFLALANPSNAQILAQVKALTQQNTKIIRRIVQLSQ